MEVTSNLGTSEMKNHRALQNTRGTYGRCERRERLEPWDGVGAQTPWWAGAQTPRVHFHWRRQDTELPETEVVGSENCSETQHCFVLKNCVSVAQIKTRDLIIQHSYHLLVSSEHGPRGVRREISSPLEPWDRGFETSEIRRRQLTYYSRLLAWLTDSWKMETICSS
jgi:hypothetical protein